MSNESKDLYNYQYPPSFSLYELMTLPTSTPSYGNNGYGPPSYSLADCLQSSPGAYDSLLPKTSAPSPSSSEVFNSYIDQESKREVSIDVIGETPTRVSASSSASEADHPGEDSGKGQKKRELVGDGGEENQSSKKVGKSKKNEEKKQREPRVSFMTKSEVDHLEDGYRWRKYGQKAVKNSIYPRSYYRCTTQKCNVKKRVERSFQDPTVVITTYEGQHNHPLPTNLRGSSAAAAMYSADFITPGSFTHDMFRSSAYTSGGFAATAFDYGSYEQSGYGSVNANPSTHQEYHQGGEYELLKEIFPSIFFRQEP
ncbi:putative WRKY transcription factor 28 [Raphanus sativus]|uniref:WRKY transcription factor n=1 Tax=Raphanus sativus TaxID=3726 RepID=A0A6J0M977_RAPSA|nr:WRKY transcription factor 28 [Raphanus sativus]KAJ4912567.1 putative WRKY transcription factor 28 [Raphanus sativus]